ncbi:phage tail protein [Cupriavidus oxalaticus]|uniref:Phage tail protein n=1 Tax=Cupriavidus oxalaticus TaxID=96344 RepID=A0A5P3VLR2_9BURK|nr:phage tail protein [Cupriavidus oxalaticus]QEZ47177.1 phage tail protein [Cupriavidus oxalaticus]
MSQHDMDIANQAGAGFRADVNLALQALVGNSSGSSEPAVAFPYQFWADTNAGVLKMRNAANNAWIKIGLLGVANFGLILPGTIVFHAKNTAPAGFLKMNAGAVSRATYADLFAEIGTTFGSGDGSTTFNLPEGRAEFFRGWDDGRGVDSGRVFGSAQAFAMQDHAHLLQKAFGSGALGGVLYSENAGTVVNNSTFNGNMANGAIATETRPRNIALLACIKY